MTRLELSLKQEPTVACKLQLTGFYFRPFAIPSFSFLSKCPVLSGSPFQLKGGTSLERRGDEIFLNFKEVSCSQPFSSNNRTHIGEY